MQETLFDKNNIQSIVSYAEKLVGKTFNEIISDYNERHFELSENADKYLVNQAKGNLGNIVEKYYFEYEPNSMQEPDFEEVGMELKVSPYEIKKNHEIKAGERLVLTMIPYTVEIEKPFKESHLFRKINLILFIIYFRNRLQDKLEYKVDFVNLFSFYKSLSEVDQKIIMDDYLLIQDKIKNGKAHELSEGDTIYLGACTKGATAKSSLTKQYSSDTPAKRRAFSFKQSFFTSLIQDFSTNSHPNEKIIKDISEISNLTFEETIMKKVTGFKNMSVSDLKSIFNLDTKAKNLLSALSFRMLGITSNQAEELEKANIVVKAIKLESNNTLKESMSFSTIDFLTFADETWEDSELYNYYTQTKFLFFIYKKYDNDYIFKGAQFWNMPITELETLGFEDWKKIHDTINNGVIFRKKRINSNKSEIKNNIPGIKETNIFHLRPHAAKSAYHVHLEDGSLFEHGDIDKNASMLPNGDFMTKQSFWIKSKYILSKLHPDFFK